ncbi:MAG: FtsX-like permease family protein [Chloroflexota bacterium]|nr:FtsX-like permease family protein [Chloroflexota bacterium]
MESLFGIDAGALTNVLTIVFLVGAAITAFLALRNRVMFKMAVRNIPRRRAQTALIVLGLMLATLLFSASFATGDTLAHSIRVQALDRIGLVDVTVAADEREESGRAAYFDVSVGERVREALADAPVDGVMVAAQERVAAVSADTGRSNTGVDAFGFDPAQMEGFDPLIAADGAALDMGALRPGQVYISAEVADDLDASAGSLIDLYFSETPTRVEAAGVYESGANPGSADSVVFALSDLQRVLGREGQARWVYISNDGGLVDGAEHTDAVLAALEGLEEELGLSVTAVKQDTLEQADEIGAGVASIFLIFGNFSIIAGILLIFLIFVMLAAERKRELGIARAIGAQQSHVVRLFTFEGAFYALMASAVGSVLGVVVGLAIVRVIAAALTSNFELTIAFSVRWQSMLLAFCLGMAATFIVVIVSAGRVSALNIVRAVRDIPEPPSRPPSLRESAREPLRRFTRGLGDLVLRRRISGLAAMTMGTLMAGFRLAWALVLAGWGAIALGILLTMAGFSSKQLGIFMLGTSLVLIGVPLALRHSFRLPDRPAYTIAGLALVGWWLLPFEWLEPFLGDEFAVSFDLFITSGVMMVLGAVWTVMYNSDLLTRALLALFGRNRSLAPVMRTSIAYPMASRFRTGMTLAMFSIVVFTLLVTGFITAGFASAFEDTQRFSGGFDLSADVNFNNPIPDMRAALAQTEGVDPGAILAIGSVTGLPTKVRQVGVIEEPKEPEDWFISGVDAEYAQGITYGFQLRADGYETDEQVWEALVSGEDVVAISPFLVPTRDGFGGDPQSFFEFEGFFLEDEALPEVYVEAFDFAGNESRLLRVIGVFENDALLARTMTTSHETLQRLAPLPLPTLTYFFALSDPTQAPAIEDALEGAFVENGLQATALAEFVRGQTELNLTFNRLLQGFMGLGLVVGIAALGVIAARSVVERRQQIGMLRAIGFQRSMVQTSFLLESSFIALLGIAIGIGLAAGLSAGIINSIANDFDGVRYVVPWFTIVVVVVVAYGASLLTTYAPARQAANVYPAEALRIAE